MRVKMLKSLESTMDRYQPSKALGINWKTIDRDVEFLKAYGLVHEPMDRAARSYMS